MFSLILIITIVNSCVYAKLILIVRNSGLTPKNQKKRKISICIYIIILTNIFRWLPISVLCK